MGIRQTVVFWRDTAEDDTHGYDQTHRDGPDFDCASYAYEGARAGGFDVPKHNGSTRTLRADFTKAGWTFVRYTGQDLYQISGGSVMLIEGEHVECVLDKGVWAGAHLNENGGITGGKTGDQTGKEISVRTPYKYGWEWIGYPPETEPVRPSQSLTGPRYRVYSGGKWHEWMDGVHDSSSVGDDFAGVYGEIATFIEIEGCEFEVCVHDQWLKSQNGCAGNGGQILALRIPSADFHYQVHSWGLRWHAEMQGTKDTYGTSDDYAGIMRPIDCIRCWR